MQDRLSLLDQLRTQYETARQSVPDHGEVEGFQEIDARMRKAFRWLEKAVAYLDGIKPPINHRFDLGHGLVFESPKFGHGSIGQHTSRIVGFPVLNEINIYYEIVAAKPLTIEVAPGGVSLVEKTLDAVALQFSSHKVETAEGTVRKFGAARDSGKRIVSCRLSNGSGHGDSGERRPVRAHDSGVPQHGDRRAGARGSRPPHAWRKRRVSAPRPTGRHS